MREFRLCFRPPTNMSDMFQDPVAAGYWARMRKGDKAFGRATTVLAVLLLLLVIGTIIFVRAAGAKVDFEKHQPAFFTSLVSDAGQAVKVQELDVYFHNGWYYYDVIYTTNGAVPLRYIYCGRDGIVDIVDPAIEPRMMKNRDLFDSYKTAVTKGEHKGYTPEEISSGLAQAGGKI